MSLVVGLPSPTALSALEITPVLYETRAKKPQRKGGISTRLAIFLVRRGG